MILDYARKYFKNIFSGTTPVVGQVPPGLTDEEAKEAKAVFEFVKQRSSQLEGDVFNRMYGVRTKTGWGYRRAGYVISRDFYEGDQWTYTKEEGAAMDVVNFCRLTIENYVAFLTNEEPEIDIPPKDPTDDMENARVKVLEDVIKQIFDDNHFYNHWVDAAINQSMLGDAFIVGPFWDEQEKKIWFSNVKRPEFIRVIWSDENYHRMEGFVYHYYMGLEAAYEKYKEPLNAMGIDLKALIFQTMPADSTLRTKSQEELRVRIVEGYDEQVHLFAIQDIIIEYEKHNNGFIPLVYIPNKPHPYLPWGISDIEDLLDPQRAYNEQASDMRDILKQVAYASIFGSNLDVEEIQAGVSKIYDMGEEAKVWPDPRKTDYPFLNGYLGTTKSHVSSMGGLPDSFVGGAVPQNVSGRALSVIMTPIQNKLRGKEKRWTLALQSLIKNIELLMEKHIPGADMLIQHYYKSDIFFPGTLIRDVTEELNKMLQKAQSQYTTMKNVGIKDPKGEQDLMIKELSNKILMVELSKNPQMQAQFQGMLDQQGQPGQDEQDPMAGGGAGGPGNPQAGPAAAAPTMTEDQNQGGEMPQSRAGNNVPTSQSGKGALAAAAAKRGPSIIKGKR